MNIVRFRFTMSGEYEVDLDDPATLEAYGTLNPEEMARIDQEELGKDPSFGGLINEATSFTIVALPQRAEPKAPILVGPEFDEASRRRIEATILKQLQENRAGE